MGLKTEINRLAWKLAYGDDTIPEATVMDCLALANGYATRRVRFTPRLMAIVAEAEAALDRHQEPAGGPLTSG